MRYRDIFEAKSEAAAILAKHGFEEPLEWSVGKRDYRVGPEVKGTKAVKAKAAEIHADLTSAGWSKVKTAAKDYHAYTHPDEDVAGVQLRVQKPRQYGSIEHGKERAGNFRSSYEKPIVRANPIPDDTVAFDGKTHQHYTYDPRHPGQSLAHEMTMHAVREHNKANPDNTWKVRKYGRLGKGSENAALYKRAVYDHDAGEYKDRGGPLRHQAGFIRGEHASHYRVYIRPSTKRR